MNQQRQEFNQFVQRAQKIAIVAHAGFDDDAIASCLAVYAYLKRHFPQKELHIYNESPPYTRWDWVENAERIEYLDDISDKLNQSDLVVFLDSQTYDRFTDHVGNLKVGKFRTIRIDHHDTEPDEFDLDLSQDDAIATCQILTGLLFRDDEAITHEIAKTLLVGILGDSGSFRFIRPDNAKALVMAARLVELGQIDLHKVHLKMFKISEEVWEIIRILVQNTQNVRLEEVPGLTYSFLSNSILKQFQQNDIKDAYHQYLYLFSRQIEGYPWGFVVVPKGEQIIQVSFRSISGAPDVSQIARRLGGGGHKRAAGAKIKVSDPNIDSMDIVEKALRTIRESELEIIE